MIARPLALLQPRAIRIDVDSCVRRPGQQSCASKAPACESARPPRPRGWRSRHRRLAELCHRPDRGCAAAGLRERGGAARDGAAPACAARAPACDRAQAAPPPRGENATEFAANARSRFATIRRAADSLARSDRSPSAHARARVRVAAVDRCHARDKDTGPRSRPRVLAASARTKTNSASLPTGASSNRMGSPISR